MALRETALLAIIAVAACAEERTGGGDGAPGEGVHPAGFLDVHGQEVERRDWDLALCASCHGDDFGGGVAQVSCRDCHEDGPTACDTCHGDPPSSDAHPVHLARFECTTCHVVPVTWNASGHIRGDAPPADVIFTGLAAGGSYDGAACGVYCHGEAEPRWRGGAGEAACGTCHGAPPPDHAYATCATCHPTGAAHVDGALQVGDACDDCHGGDGQAAPPRDLAGNIFTTARGVGAHRSHLEAPHQIARPVACAACHAVPADVSAPGHLDSPWPAEVVAIAGWDAANGTCTNACHGGARPIWTAQNQIACGSCHGIPPDVAPHTPEMTLDDCADCHPPFGPDQHLDGDVDVAP